MKRIITDPIKMIAQEIKDSGYEWQKDDQNHVSPTTSEVSSINKPEEIKFNGNIMIFGYGAVSRCTIPILLRHIKVDLKQITVIDKEDLHEEIKTWTDKGITFIHEKITKNNYKTIISKYLGSGDMLIDLAYNIETTDILQYCHDKNILFCNTSIEVWHPQRIIENGMAYDKSLYARHMRIKDITDKWDTPEESVTAVLDHGANPGLISHLTKQGILDIAKSVIKEKSNSTIENLIKNEKFNELAMNLGIKVIHCSERDTQITNKPKEVGEFVGTWSIDGLIEEGMSPAELGWGTHETEMPPNSTRPDKGPQNQIFIDQMGINTWVRSWVPGYEIVGMLIRHGEAFGISKYLTVKKNGKILYRPTVHYAYLPCDSTIASLHEMRGAMYEEPKEKRVMYDDIQSGADILGALIMGHKYNAWWTGSNLDINKARELVPGQNATTIQVAIGLVSAICWMVENPNKGVNIPDNLPHDKILKIAKPYLGQFISKKYDWTPAKNFKNFYTGRKNNELDTENLWNFKNFVWRD